MHYLFCLSLDLEERIVKQQQEEEERRRQRRERKKEKKVSTVISFSPFHHLGQKHAVSITEREDHILHFCFPPRV